MTPAGVAARFWAKVDKRPGFGPRGDCWRWTGAPTSNGYGALACRSAPRQKYAKAAHRLAWEIHFGPIPDAPGHHKTSVRHRCDNRLCVNPSHLALGDHAQNMADASERDRFPYRKGEHNDNSKLTEDDIRAIRNDPRILREIAADYSVNKATVGRIKNRDTWKHLL